MQYYLCKDMRQSFVQLYMTFRINNTLYSCYENFDSALTGEILDPLYAG